MNKFLYGEFIDRVSSINDNVWDFLFLHELCDENQNVKQEVLSIRDKLHYLKTLALFLAEKEYPGKV